MHETAPQPPGRTTGASSGPVVMMAVSQGFEARYLLRSDILKGLLALGCQCLILSPNWDEAYFRREFESLGCRVLPWRIEKYQKYHDARPFQSLLRQIRNLTLNQRSKTRFLDDKNPLKAEGSSAKAKVLGSIAWLASGVLRRWRGGRRLLVLLENRLYVPDVHGDIFKSHRPDAVVCTSPGYWLQDTYLLREAKRHEVSTAVAMLSWDNPSSKGYPGVEAELIMAWTEAMKRELVELADIPPQKIEVKGVAHFDIYERLRDQLDREAFLEQLGCDPEKKTVLFATKAPGVFPNLDIVKILAEANAKGLFGDKVHFVIRLHPIYTRNKYTMDDVNQKRLSAMIDFVNSNSDFKISMPVVKSQKLHLDMPSEEMENIARLIGACDVIVSVLSTMNLEAALLDKPMVNIAFNGLRQDCRRDGYRPVEYEYEMPHVQRLLSHEGSLVASTKEQLISHIKAYLDNPGLHREGRQRIAAAECGPYKGQAGRKISRAIYDFLVTPDGEKR